MFRVTVRNKAQVIAWIQSRGPKAAAALDDALVAAAGDVAARARGRAPRLTGALRSSIVVERYTTKAGNPGIRVAAYEFYARFVEFGTRASTTGQLMIDGTGGNLSRSRAKTKRIRGFRIRKAKRTHNGTRPRPFFFVAYRAVKPTIRPRVARAVETALRS